MVGVEELTAALPLVELGTPLGKFMHAEPLMWDRSDQVGPYIKNMLPKTWKLLGFSKIPAHQITLFVSEKCSDQELPYPEERLLFLPAVEREAFLKIQSKECATFEPKEHKEISSNLLVPFVVDSLEAERKGGFGCVQKVVEQGIQMCRKRLPWDTEQHKLESAAELKILQKVPEAPHLLQLRASYVQGTYHYLVLQPWVTTDLEQFVRDPDSFPFWSKRAAEDKPALIISWFQCIAAGLATLHSHLLKHIDIKLANIGLEVVGDEVEPYLLDYGHSRSFDRNSESRALELYGTLHYESPEKLERRLEGRKGDVFSTGVVYMELMGLISPSIKKKWERLVRTDRQRPLPASSMALVPRWADDFFADEHPVAQKLGAIIVEMLRLDSSARLSAREVHSRLTADWAGVVGGHCYPVIKHPSPTKKAAKVEVDEDEGEAEEAAFEEVDSGGGPAFFEMFGQAYLN